MILKELLRLKWELNLVGYPPGTHLSRSRFPRGSIGLVRDADNALVTHAVQYPVGKVVAVAAVAAAAGVFMLGVANAPRVKSRFNDLKAKLNGKPEDTAEAAPQEARPEQSDVGVEGHGSRPRHLYVA